MRAIAVAALAVLATTTACSKSGPPMDHTAEPRTIGFVASSSRDLVAFASPVAWDEDIDESWVGVARPGDTKVSVLPDLPIDVPFAEPAIQVTGTAILLLATECPEPSPDDEDGGSCGPGQPLAFTYDLATERWATFTPPPLPDGPRIALGLLDGAAAFGVLAPTGPGSSAELVAFVEGSGVAPWIPLAAPPLADVADACVTDQGLVAVETPQLSAFVNAGNKTFEEIEEERRELEELDDGTMYAARYDLPTATWSKTEVSTNRMVGSVSCQGPGIVFTRGNAELVVHPASGTPTTFTASGEIGPDPSVAEIGSTLVATYGIDVSDPTVEQAMAAGGRASSPEPLDTTSHPVASFALDGSAAWAGIADHHLTITPITT